MSRLFRQSQSLLLVLLMSMALLGVQMVQASSLHIHEQHSVDCALCHFQLSDDAEFSNAVVLPEQLSTFNTTSPETFRLTSRTIRPYQSRAPPSLPC